MAHENQINELRENIWQAEKRFADIKHSTFFLSQLLDTDTRIINEQKRIKRLYDEALEYIENGKINVSFITANQD